MLVVSISVAVIAKVDKAMFPANQKQFCRMVEIGLEAKRTLLPRALSCDRL